jgi:predicted small lipoprotein YifL
MNMILITVISFFLFACGIKGPPLPPIKETTIQKQKLTDSVSPNQAPPSSSDETKVKQKKK